MKNLSNHYSVVLAMILWIKENRQASIEPTYEGYLADTAIAGASTARREVYDFVKNNVENPEPWNIDESQRVYLTSEKDFKEANPVHLYPGVKVFSLGERIILTDLQNVEIVSKDLKEIFEPEYLAIQEQVDAVA